jgi:hypothetical protein
MVKKKKLYSTRLQLESIHMSPSLRVILTSKVDYEARQNQGVVQKHQEVNKGDYATLQT